MKENLALGIDVGSTTTKLVLMDGSEIIYQNYQRHLAKVRQTAVDMLRQMREQTGISSVRMSLSGSAGMGLAEVRFASLVV